MVAAAGLPPVLGKICAGTAQRALLAGSGAGPVMFLRSSIPAARPWPSNPRQPKECRQQRLSALSRECLQQPLSLLCVPCLSCAVLQVPVIQVMLGQLGIVTSEQMFGLWRYVVVGATVAAAVLTPSTDPFTQALLAIPLVGLYMGGAFMVRVLEQRKLAAGAQA